MEKPHEQINTGDKIGKNTPDQTEKKVIKPLQNREIPKEDNPYFSRLTIPHLEDAEIGLFEKGKVNIVLHPFYEMLLQNTKSFDKDLWNDIKANPEKYDPNKSPGIIYCEQWIIKELNRTLKESNETGLSTRYWRVLEMAQEYQALTTMRNSTETYLYILPGYTTFKDSGAPRDPALYEALIDIANYGANKSTIFVESEDWSNGKLRGADAVLMDLYMPENTELTIAGGYIGKCMQNLFDSMNKGRENNNWKINVDVTNSTPILFFDSPDPNFHPGLVPKLPSESQPNYKPGQQFSNMEDVSSFVNANSGLNSYITKGTKEHLIQRGEPSYVTYQ